MKLAIVTENFDAHGGGAERSVVQIARHLARRGHAVTVIAAHRPLGAEAADDAGVQVVSLSAYPQTSAWRLLRFARWARGQLAAGGFDVTLSATMAVSANVLQPRGGTVRETLARNIAIRRGPLARALKAALVAASPKQRALLALERRTLGDPSVRRIVAVSQYVADQLRRHYHVDESRIQVLPNAADMPAVDDAQRRDWRQRVRQGFDIADDAVVYLFAAYNPKLKGVRTLLLASAALTQRGVPFTLIMAGRLDYAQQHLAARLGIRHRVRMIGVTEQMAQLYCAADVTVLPTWYDPSSKVVIESLMMGTPAITTRFNGAADFVTANGVCRGRVVSDPADAAALADAMAELADPDERARCHAATAGLAGDLAMARHVQSLESVLIAATAGAAAGD